MEMTYLKFLEEQNALLKDANEQLKEKIDSSQTSRLIAEKNRLNEICIYWENEHDKLSDENEKLKQENQDLEKVKDNFVKESYKLKKENDQLKQQITQLKNIKRNDHKTIDRLIKIITDEHYD